MSATSRYSLFEITSKPPQVIWRSWHLATPLREYPRATISSPPYPNWAYRRDKFDFDIALGLGCGGILSVFLLPPFFPCSFPLFPFSPFPLRSLPSLWFPLSSLFLSFCFCFSIWSTGHGIACISIWFVALRPMFVKSVKEITDWLTRLVALGVLWIDFQFLFLLLCLTVLCC